MNKIKQLRKEKGFSQAKLAQKLNVHQTAVSQWELNRTVPDIDTLKNLSDLFGVSVDYLLGRTNEVSNVTPIYTFNKTENKSPSKGIKIPVLGRVIAGIPVEAVEEILEFEEITPEMAAQGEHFALQIKGDSMEPRMLSGDVVIVRKQSDADTGDTAVVLVNGNEATIKKIKKSDDGIMLIPTNPNYEVMFYSTEQIKTLPVSIIGKVVELRCKY